ncbi:hypothetical protein BGZ97_007856 [Linnemannia gamsii]|uniref:Galactose oxidase n=1 Tax=Linnemannia gamsii TaxID=64522 RepID=A0A9P6UER8_9FUNG|nr:hypothetical protein BGZ97_007856 [Linnemannia gamsii]
MALDLAISWNSTSPAWIKLKDGPIQTLNTAAFSSDEQAIFTFNVLNTNSAWVYNVQNNTWRESKTLTFETAGYSGITAVTDPNTGLIFLAGGYEDPNAYWPYRRFMDVVDPITQTFRTVDLPDPLKFFTYRSYYGNEDGTIIAIYGGDLNEITVGELWTLNLVTSTWSQGLTGSPRKNAACTIAGGYLLVWGGMMGGGKVAPTDMVIYNLNTSSYETQYTPPAYYKDLTPPSPLTRTKAPWDTGDWPKSLTSRVTVGIVLIRRRRKQGEPEGRKGLRDNNTQRGLKGLLGDGGGRGFGKRAKNSPQESNEDDELARTLQELVDQEMELAQKRQMLVLHHQESNPRPPMDQKRGPTAVMGGKEEVHRLPPPPPSRLSPGESHSASYSVENLNDRRTVQAVSGPFDMYHSDRYADDGPRRHSELAQDVIEPLYGPSPTVCNSIPDLVFEPSPDVGMDWTKQQKSNHPHAVVDPSGLVIQH